MPGRMSALFKIEINWLRGIYIAVFFCNAIFATMFKTIGQGLLSSFGTFSECDSADIESCQGNQMIFRASFSISMFFLMKALLSRFGWVQPRQRTMMILVWVEIPVLVALLVGSFYIPNTFFDGYVPFTRVASGFFILFQIFSIVSVSYQVRDTLLNAIENAEKAATEGKLDKGSCAGSVCLWYEYFSPFKNHFLTPTFARRKTAFLGVCAGSLVAVGAAIAYLYMRFGDCSLGLAFTTITIVAASLLIIVCISSWLEVGLLPPCAISAYLVLMCWQALVSNPDKTCEHRDHPPPTPQDEEAANTNSMIANAVIAAFAMTWTSWRTSSAAAKLLVRRSPPPLHRDTSIGHPANSSDQFTAVVVMPTQHTDEIPATTPAVTTVEPSQENRELIHEPWQFYSMMCLAGLYMAMVLTDWNSADGYDQSDQNLGRGSNISFMLKLNVTSSFNAVSMWVKIVAQWVTILMFSWTLIAPKLFPDRDFS